MNTGSQARRPADWPAAIAREAESALLFEAAAAPKPGLVTPLSAGAHTDMDYFLFLKSGAALAPYFETFAHIGAELAPLPAVQTLPMLRKAGLEAENAMFEATGGINTHKGLIFSLGILCAAASRLVCRGTVPSAHNTAQEAAAVTEGLCQRDFAGLGSAGIPEGGPISALSAGESLFLRYGTKGIRAEVEAGFPSVLGYSLPRFNSDRALGLTINDALVNALISLFPIVEDSNVLNRAGPAGLQLLKDQGRLALDRGGMAAPEGRAAIEAMDRRFTESRISPGGCADLLADTVFLWNLEALSRA